MKIDLTVDSEGKVRGTFTPSIDDAAVILPTKDIGDVLEALDKTNDTPMGLLPPAVRWMSSDKRIVVFERPPTTKMISWIPLPREEISNWSKQLEIAFVIPVPWQVYVVYFDQGFVPVSVRMFFRTEMLSSMQDTLCLAPILNFYYNSQLCNPIYEVYEEQEPTVSAGVNAAYNLVWNSGFNYDLQDAPNWAMRSSMPFRKLKDPLTAKKDYVVQNGKVDSGYIDNTFRFYSTWADKTLYDVLEAQWPGPLTNKRGAAYENIYPTLESIISTVLSEAKGYDIGVDIYSQQFIVGLVNIMTS